MKKIHLNLVIVIISLFTQVNAQNVNNNFKQEKISFITDRNLYIVGENIHFTTNLIYNDSVLSKIIYVELITPEGKTILENKYRLTDSYCSDIIKIPTDILSGYYYLKAYTKFMRNNGPLSYNYTSLKIVNPYNDEVLDYNPSVINTIDTTSYNDINNNTLQITTPKKIYTSREKASIDIICNKKSDYFKNICVAVIPESSYYHMDFQVIEKNNKKSNEFYYPETRGISITGKVIDNNSKEVLPYTTINLSIIGENKDIISKVSDSLGYFYFALPDLMGKNDIFLSCEIKTGTSPKLLIFNDFCSKKINIKTPAFKLTEKEKAVAYKMAVSCQISSFFPKEFSTESKHHKISYDNPFYGEPTKILDPDDYIELPTLEDCFRELPFKVKVEKNNGEKNFRIIGTESYLSVYAPLILLDMVAVTDYDKILSIPPKTVSHIEIVTEPYTKGIMTYGGIISIFSKDGDYCGINLPESGIFLNYDFLSNTINSTKNDISSKLPDTRNTLAWVPNLVLDRNGRSSVSFFTSDVKGKYVIFVKGVTNSGKIINSSEYIEVK